ncbi:aminoacyl-tRNA hydrolase [bacterium]|nr:aminoacyl-tRNA hydrolase [bacterium]
MKIIVGLGNPEPKYKNTRHNLGFLILDWLNPSANWEFNKKFNALIFSDGINIFVKPQTYMNESGISVSRVLNYYNLLPKKMGIFAKKDLDLSNSLIIIHDDLDINKGKIKFSKNSSSAGHKGINSIIKHLKTKNFTRIRIGVKPENEEIKIPIANYVLQKMSENEIKINKESFLKKEEEIKEQINS